MDSPRGRRTSTVGDFDRARHSLFSRLLVLFVTTGLLGCAAPVSDSTDLPAGDESPEPGGALDGKADQLGANRYMLPDGRLESRRTPSGDRLLSIPPLESREGLAEPFPPELASFAINFDHGYFDLAWEVTSECTYPSLVVDLRSGHAQLYGRRESTTGCGPGDLIHVAFSMRSLMPATSVTLPFSNRTILLGEDLVQFLKSPWSKSLTCHAVGPSTSVANLYTGAHTVIADLTKWAGGHSSTLRVESLSNQYLIAATSDYRGEIQLQRSGHVISGTIASNEQVHEVTCTELRSP